MAHFGGGPNFEFQYFCGFQKNVYLAGGGGGIINHKTGLFSILFYFIFFGGGGYFYAFKGNFIRAGYRMGNLVWGSDLYRSLFGSY